MREIERSNLGRDAVDEFQFEYDEGLSNLAIEVNADHPIALSPLLVEHCEQLIRVDERW
jgi:hypothetical protein